MLTLKQSMELAGECCIAWLDPEHGYMPTCGYEVAHDSGRWWDAMLRLGEATGFRAPADIEAAMLRNILQLTGNPDGLLMNDPSVEWMRESTMINPHNYREGLLAFAAMVKYRDCAEARAAGLKMLATMDRCMDDDGWFDYSKLECWGKVPYSTDDSHPLPPKTGWYDSTGDLGRGLEGVLAFYQATGAAIALDVADRIVRLQLRTAVHPDGSPRWEILVPENVGHNHSCLGTLRALVRYGLLTGQREYVDAVAATYRGSLWDNNITESGWTPHDLGKPRFPNAAGDPVGETASCGDVVQIALWLALEAGQPELLDDVERLVRCRILPSQVTPADAANPENAGVTLGPREMGSWGAFGAPNSKGWIIDVIAAVLHTLTDVYANVVTRETGGLKVNLHLTCDRPEAEVVSERGEEARVRVRPKVPGNVLLRVPGWAPRESLRLTVGGREYPLRFVGGYLLIGGEKLQGGEEIALTHALPERMSTERFRSGAEYHLAWRGDEVVGVSPRETPLAIWPAIPSDWSTQ
jgi:hypothetical protein